MRNLLFVLSLIVIFSACKKTNNVNTNTNSGYTSDTMIYYNEPVSSSNVTLGSLYYVSKGVQFNFYGNTDANGNISKVTAVTLKKINSTDTVYNYVLDSISNVAYYYISVYGINDSIVLSYTYQDTTKTITGYNVNWNTLQSKIKEQAVVNNNSYLVQSDFSYRIAHITGNSFISNAIDGIIAGGVASFDLAAGTVLIVGGLTVSGIILPAVLISGGIAALIFGAQAFTYSKSQIQQCANDLKNKLSTIISNIPNPLNLSIINSAQAGDDVPPNPAPVVAPIAFVDPATLPVVTTSPVTAVTNNSAACGGNVTSNGVGPGNYIISKGVCWSSSNPNPTLDNNKGFTDNGAGGGQFTSAVAFLLASTQYYVRAYATNANGTSYGLVDPPFTTASSTYATITTAAVTSVTSTSAISGGNITNDGGSPVTARGVYYATHSNPTVLDKSVPAGSGTGSFTCNMTGLLQGVQYYAKAYAINSTGTSYGNEQTFTTVANPLDNTDWIGYYTCPTWPPGLYPAGSFPTYPLTPAGYAPITMHFAITGNTITANVYWVIGSSSEVWIGTINSANTEITWTSAGVWVFPSAWSISGITITGVGGLTPGAGCVNMPFTLLKQ